MIKYLRDKYYWYRVNTKIESYFKNKYENKILIYGFPKSGNTWVRFLIYNYLNLLNNINVTKTISFDKLNELQNNVMDRGTTFYNKKGYPIIYRTHKIFVKPYLLFDKRIFIHRNPLDTLISSYYFYKNREIPFSGDDKKYRDLLFDINFYVRYKLEDWINFYTQSVKYAHLNINYSDIISNPHRILLKIVEFLDLEVNKKFIDKSGNSIEKKVELFTWEKLDFVKQIKNNFNI